MRIFTPFGLSMRVFGPCGLSIVGIVVLVFSIFGDGPSISVPATVQGQIGDFVQVKATTTGKTVQWVVCDTNGLTLFPPHLLKNSHTAVVVGKVNGTYRLIAITCAGDAMSDPAVCNVVIGTSKSSPFSDPLFSVLQSLYTSDTSVNKQAAAKSLASLYRQAAAYTDDSSIKTLGNFNTILKKTSSTLVPKGALTPLRARVSRELTSLGTSPIADFDKDTRSKAKTLFNRLALIMDSLSTSAKGAK